MKKALVAYFSCSGITEQLAHKLAEVVKGEVYEIKPAVPYIEADLNWQDKNARSTLEMNDHSSRPAVSGREEKLDDYDKIYVGFPIWWYIAPTIINTFLESYDFSGKTIIPFATSGMSGVGETDKWLHGSCSKETHWRPAKRFPSNVSQKELKQWVDSLQL